MQNERFVITDDSGITHLRRAMAGADVEWRPKGAVPGVARTHSLKVS